MVEPLNTSPDKQPRFRLGMFQVGDVWLLQEPGRIARVEEITTHQVPQPGGAVLDMPAIRAKVTTARHEIPGFVDAAYAKSGQSLQLAIEAEHAREGRTDDRVWEEIWSEILVHTIREDVARARGTYVVQDGPNAPQYPVLVTVADMGRDETRAQSSPCRGPVLGWKIPPELVPEDLFIDEAEARAAAKRKAEAAAAEKARVRAEADAKKAEKAAKAKAAREAKKAVPA